MLEQPNDPNASKSLIEQLCTGRDLDQQQTLALFDRVLAGELDDIGLTALLVALKTKGETSEEIAGAAMALRRAAAPFDSEGLEIADTCGTGGSGTHTINISTAVGVVAAELGLHVAKHGNRSITSRCGSADVLEQCGVNITADPQTSRRCLEQQRICFLFAPQYHPGVRNAMPVRRALGMRTIFNILGPLANPAMPRWQILGVYDPSLCMPMAKTLALLGCISALVVHGAGLDEIALHEPTTAALLQQGQIEPIQIDPQHIGLPRRDLEELQGGDPADNAKWLQQLLSGKGKQSHKEAVAINTGALMWISGAAKDLQEGTEVALQVLETDRPAERLRRWAEQSYGA